MPETLARQSPKAAPEPLTLVRGVLDLRGQHGFLRINGYRPSSRDISVPPGMIRRHNLRAGDLVTGSSTAERTKNPNKHDVLTHVDTVNDIPLAELDPRPDFYQLTPLYPQERLRLETEPHVLTTRVIDLLMPIGKGQRALIVSPPKAGKTMALQAIAHAVAINHPETHLMALLVDERPEEVTDMQRTINGEVIASTFDRPPAEHISVAELAMERAKRLVELGRDVVLLLDSITRLGRAYNLVAPANGRVMTGGIEAGALHAPKRFLGAARNVEGGGSLTIIATALVETGSTADTVIFEEFKSTGNAELRLTRTTADRRVFPAVDLASSGTRKEELLLNAEELGLVRKLRTALHQVDGHQRAEQLLTWLRATNSNTEFLLRLSRSRS